MSRWLAGDRNGAAADLDPLSQPVLSVHLAGQHV